MDKSIRKEIIRLWDAMLPMEQIYQMLPCKLADAKRYVANLRKDGTLKPRSRKAHSMQKVSEAYKSGITDIDELADMFSFTRLTVIEYLHKQKVTRERPRTYTHLQFSPKTQEIIQHLKEAKISQTNLAKKYGVSRQYINYLSNKY